MKTKTYLISFLFPAEITEEDEEEGEAEPEETNATPGDEEEQSEAKDESYGALCHPYVGTGLGPGQGLIQCQSIGPI